ncbi:hypothetical protein LEMLEM_LOCUS26229, partial [Lemmus lemmus]
QGHIFLSLKNFVKFVLEYRTARSLPQCLALKSQALISASVWVLSLFRKFNPNPEDFYSAGFSFGTPDLPSALHPQYHLFLESASCPALCNTSAGLG